MNKNKVLVIIDMQNDFIGGSLANKEAKKIVPKIAELIKHFDGNIIFTRDTHSNGYLDSNEGKHLPVEHCIKGTFGHQIHRDLLGWKDATVIDKKYFCSKDDLFKEIKSHVQFTDPRELEIHVCGTVSEICVVSNVLMLKARFPESKIIVHEDLCAGLDKKGHDAAMLVMERCQCEIVKDNK